jgi:hypothetical protein
MARHWGGGTRRADWARGKRSFALRIALAGTERGAAFFLCYSVVPTVSMHPLVGDRSACVTALRLEACVFCLRIGRPALPWLENGVTKLFWGVAGFVIFPRFLGRVSVSLIRVGQWWFFA